MGAQLRWVDAFTGDAFRGNPAAVCLVDTEPDPEWMQALAREMGLSETAFVVPRDDSFGLRWFTPTVEVRLCGHATLASAHTLYETDRVAHTDPIRFHTRFSGVLTCTSTGDTARDHAVEMDFPASPLTVVDPPADLLTALAVTPLTVLESQRWYFVELATPDDVKRVAPDFELLATVGGGGATVTARSDHPGVDFVSRVFGPGVGIPEDPVTGSAHCGLAPFWAGRLGRNELVGYQASARGGTVRCRVDGDRVHLGGRAVTVLAGDLQI